MAWQAAPAVRVVADLKRIGWKAVMKDFKMRYESAGVGGSVDFALPQNWKDQTVLQFGAEWAATPEWTLRGGFNRASQPIPEAYVNPLFPATVERHLTAGFGYAFSQASALNASVAVAPKSTTTNGDGIKTTHRQTNLQLMYSLRF